MLFWVGIVVLLLGIALYSLTYFFLGPKTQRLMNRNVGNLQEMVDTGEAAEFGEGADELLKDAIAYQRQHQIGPIPLVKPAVVLMAVGLLLAAVGYFTS